MNKKTVTAKTALVLAIGQAMLTTIKQSNTDEKVVLEFAESFAPQNTNPLAVFNQSDERFNSKPSIRRAWLAVQKDSLSMLGISQETINKVQENPGVAVEVNIKNPKVLNPTTQKEERLVIQLEDSQSPTDYEKENVLDKAKKSINAKTGEEKYFMHKGMFIFQHPTVQFESARKHTIINSDARISRGEAEDVLAQLAASNEGDAIN
jgi:hypothetical protein